MFFSNMEVREKQKFPEQWNQPGKRGSACDVSLKTPADSLMPNRGCAHTSVRAVIGFLSSATSCNKIYRNILSALHKVA